MDALQRIGEYIARLIHRTNRLQSGYVYTIDMYTLPRRLA